MKYDFKLKVADSENELQEIYKFRYRIYVEEMQRRQNDANHICKTVRDQLDDWGRNFFVTHGDRIVGVVRGNFFRDGYDSKYEEMYSPEVAGIDHPTTTCMVTRLMIDPKFRGTSLVLEIFLWLYDYALNHELKWIFLDCNESLIPFFQKFGFCEYRGKVEHAEYGLVTPMRIQLMDHQHLKQVASPYLSLLDTHLSRK